MGYEIGYKGYQTEILRRDRFPNLILPLLVIIQ